MIKYKIADKQDIDQVMAIRLEMLLEVNNLSEQYQYADDFVSARRE